MSTVIRPNPDHGNTVELRGHGSTVDVFAMTDRETVTWRTVPRADFLAAVEAECGVTAIDLADLPTVGRRGTEFTVGNLIADPPITAEDAREAAREWLALADYLDAHPPIDEAQVEALAMAMDAAGMVGTTDVRGREDFRPYARRLIAEGWSK